jgi:hypothetical protein
MLVFENSVAWPFLEFATNGLLMRLSRKLLERIRARVEWQKATSLSSVAA